MIDSCDLRAQVKDLTREARLEANKVPVVGRMIAAKALAIAFLAESRDRPMLHLPSLKTTRAWIPSQAKLGGHRMLRATR